jgi:hypothetical protein
MPKSSFLLLVIASEAWQSPILVIYILGFDIAWDLEIGI